MESVPTNKKKTIGSRILLVASLLAVVLYPVLFLFFRNVSLLNLNEVLSTYLIFAVNAIVILAVLTLLLKSFETATLITMLAMIVIMLFKLIEKLIIKVFPGLYYWHVLYIVCTILALISIIIVKKVNPENAAKLANMFGLIFLILIVVNFIFAFPAIREQAAKTEVETTQIKLENTGGMSDRNVYLFIFDEYSGLDALERYNHYDNSKFYAELESLGFVTAPHSRNYTTSTRIEIPNILNLSLTLKPENFNVTEKDKLLEDLNLFSLFKQKGYFNQVISDQEFIPANSKNVDRFFIGQSEFSKAETFQLVALRQSVYYPFFTYKENARADKIKSMFEQMKSLPQNLGEKTLTVGYFMFPHLPWVLDENGHSISPADRENWKDTDVYLGQLKFVSTNILAAMTEIIRQDPNAIIILGSDHGYRLPIHLERWYGEKIENRELEQDFQRNVLNAVYFGGEALEIDNMSVLNTIITVLNKLFGSNLPAADEAYRYE